MQYSTFPESPLPSPINTSTNQVSGKNFFGSGTSPYGTIINLGGVGGIYLDASEGIYAGSATTNTFPAHSAAFTAAPFSIDFNGNMIANSATIASGASGASGARIAIDPATGSIKIYDNSNTLVGTLFANPGQVKIARDTSANAGYISIGAATLGVYSSVTNNGQVQIAGYDTTFSDSATMGVQGNNGITLGGTGLGNKLGFYNTPPIAKPTITGSRAGNAALASLLTSLANLGLLVDSTSA